MHVHVRTSMHLFAFTVLGGIDNFEMISSMYLQNAGIHCLTHDLHCCEIPPAPNHEFMHRFKYTNIVSHCSIIITPVIMIL